ncbi:GNAT family N-acetyltransferase [Lacinutrix mariniflava]|uniref:GNAT family N-acetyltransferase n=1 Tax=Lacinutrix mariniflava TaxID=342955 RepID=UPI0006E40FF0|nr:GNAT family N-acetyltransferase [Lacinutrix mariniflava]
MKIRKGKDSDISQIINLFKILDLKHIKNQNDFKQFINLERYTYLIDKCLKEQDYFLIIAENSDKLIGFGIGRLLQIENHPFLKNKKIGEILYLVIDEEFKLNGYGKNILKTLENQLKLKGAESFELRVYNFNKEAQPEKVNYKKKFTIYEKSIE